MWLELDGEGPLYAQAYRGLRERILDGALRPGTRLPATRSLARETGLSRNTVLQAYQQLLDEGYATARTGAGTFVASTLPEERVVAGAKGDLAARARDEGDSRLRLSAHSRRQLAAAPRGHVSWGVPRRHLPYDFRYGEPAYGELPLETWFRLLGRRARRASASRLAYGEPGGSNELRSALAAYLRRARGVRCEPEQVLIVCGTQQAIDLCARVLVDPGDRVALEEPHYTGFSLALAGYGAELITIPVDHEGLCVDALEAADPVRGICVTPSHQFPTGGILPLTRRLQLLDYASRQDAFVLEDDYDSEFRYDGRPIASLQGLDDNGRVLYMGTASKLLFPSIRIGWLVAPEPLVAPLTVAKALCDTGSPTLEQLTLADFIEGGHLERHVRRSRVRNGERREVLQEAVTRHLGGAASLVGTRAGLHGLLWLRGVPSSREGEFRRRCAREGVGIYPVNVYYAEPTEEAGFVLGYTALDEPTIREGVRRIASVLEGFLAE